MSSVTNVASDEALTKEAYARVKADWAKLAGDQLLQVNLELHFAAETVLGAWRKLKTFRDQMKVLPNFDISHLDRLEDYVLALRYVQSRYAMATKGPNNLDELVEEADKLCDILEADARALARRGLFDSAKLAALQGGNSYKALAEDLEALANELEAIFPQIEHKSAIAKEDLKAATQMATRLTRVLGEQQLSPEIVAALTEERQRAFTQLIKSYDEARAALAFLRRAEEDADKIAPNLYTGNSRRRKGEVAQLPSPAPGVLPPIAAQPPSTSPSGNGGSPPTPTTPSTSSPFMT